MKTEIIISVFKIITILLVIFLCIFYYKELSNILEMYFMTAFEQIRII